jgi:hypothetical protein
MLVKIDEFLLDKVTQPVVDKLANIASCFLLSRITLGLSVTCEVVRVLLLYNRTGQIINYVLLMVILFLVSIVYNYIGKIEKKTKPNVVNTARFEMFIPRIFCLFGTIFNIAGIGSGPLIENLMSVGFSAFYWISLYFVSCNFIEPNKTYRYVMPVPASS